MDRPPPLTVLTLFGTRPEIIKLAPVIRALETRPERFRAVNVASGQHADLLSPFVHIFSTRIDYNLHAMQPGQSLNALSSRVLASIDHVLEHEKPDAVLVQGDTTTALMGALAAFYRRIPVGHVEAGLRTSDAGQPFPEETNRRLISRLASWHFAATRRNRRALVREGVPPDQIALTGNPIVDSLHAILARHERSPRLQQILDSTRMYRRIALTTHHRESFGSMLEGNLRVLREFIERQTDVALIFPVNPNPVVRRTANAILGNSDRIWLTEPLDYLDFIGLLSESWLIISDSGRIQEEAPSLGKRVLVLRDVTERPEAIEAGMAKLVGDPHRLAAALKEEYWRSDNDTAPVVNPFGRGDSGLRIARALWRGFHSRPLSARRPPKAAAKPSQ